MGIPATLSSVPATTPYIQYIATNGQTVFPYPFPITQDSDLIVVVSGVTLGTDVGYAVSGVGNDTGGNVTFTLGQTAGTIVTLFRDIAIQRVSQIAQNSGFSSTVFNAEFNNIYLILQQLQDSLGFALQVPNTNSPAPVTTLLPANYNGKYLAFDASGNPTPALLTSSGALTQAIIAGLYNPQTPSEATAGVTPLNYAYATLNPLRYGAVGDNVADDHVAVQTAFTVAGVAGGTVVFPPGYTFLCNADISVPVAASTGGPIASAQGPGWATISVRFGGAAVFGFTLLGTGATTGGTTGSTYNYAGTFRDIAIQVGAGMSAFYFNSINQPRVENCWIRGAGTTSNRAVLFLNCLLPVSEDCLVTGCGSATQYSIEFDNCTTAACRGSRISGGNTTKGGLAIDRCTNFVVDGLSSESCGTPIVISGKTETTLSNTGIILRGLELENPGSGNPFVSIGAGLSGSALVVDVLLDGMYGSPSGTTTVPYAVQIQNTVGFEAKGSHFTLGSTPTSCFELTGTNIAGVVIRPHRNLQSLAIPWVRYNSAQVLAAGPQMEWQLGGLQSTGGRPTCTSRGFSGLYSATALTGTAPSILVSSTMGGFYANIGITNASPATVTTLSGGEPGMEITIIPTDGNTTLTNGNSGGAFRLVGGSNLNIAAGKAYKFINDGANGASGGSCWVQV